MLSSQRGHRVVRPSVANGGTEWDPRRVGAGSSKKKEVGDIFTRSAIYFGA